MFHEDESPGTDIVNDATYPAFFVEVDIYFVTYDKEHINSWGEF